MSAYLPQKGEIAGFELFGRRQLDGSILLGTSRVYNTSLPDFPPEVEVVGVTYTLEFVKKNEGGDQTIEWGVYV